MRARLRVRNLPDAMCTKTVVIRDFGGMGMWLTGGVLHELIFFLFSIFKISFLKTFMPCVFLTFGKLFAVCPINGTRQRISLPMPIYRVHFVMYNTQQKICRGYFGICRVPWHTTKEPIPIVYITKLSSSCFLFTLLVDLF